jgi:hypothetical protein
VVDQHPGTQVQLLDATVTAQRAILRARRPEDVVAALERTVQDLGGSLVPAHIDGDEVLPIDIGVGVRGPLLPWAPPDDPARGRLERVLPPLVEDATAAVQRLWRLNAVGDPTLHDDLTGALSPAATIRLITRARTGDVLVGFALASTGPLARRGHDVRLELALIDLTACVRSELDVDERLGRLHGLGVVATLNAPPEDRAPTLLDRVDERWSRRADAAEVPLVLGTSAVEEDPVAALAGLREELQLVRDGQDLIAESP